MAYRFPMTYYYISPENNERLTAFREATGDSEKVLVTQYVRGWLGRNRRYYTDLAKMDVAKREMNTDEWVETIVDKGVETLSPYKQPILDDDIPRNPLGHVILPSNNMIQRWLNYIELGKQNIALLRVAILYDGGSVTKYISRIIQEHIERNWDTLYAAQVAAEHSNNWLKGE